jgi:hypothetical protein
VRAPSRKRSRKRQRRKIDLGRALFVLPNLVTLASVFCGFNAIRIVATDNPTVDDFYKAAVLLTFAMLFDLLDGRIARMTRTQSAFASRTLGNTQRKRSFFQSRTGRAIKQAS